MTITRASEIRSKLVKSLTNRCILMIGSSSVTISRAISSSYANTQNRANQRNPHTTSAKSQSQRIYELNKKAAEREANEEVEATQPPPPPPEVQVYADTHKRRGGEWITPATQKNFEDMAGMHTEAVEQGTQLPGVEIMEKVLKKKPAYAQKTKRTEKDRRLEAELQAEREQRAAGKESSERRSKQLEDQVAMQQQKSVAQDEKFVELEESHISLLATVKDLVVRMDQQPKRKLHGHV